MTSDDPRDDAIQHRDAEPTYIQENEPQAGQQYAAGSYGAAPYGYGQYGQAGQSGQYSQAGQSGQYGSGQYGSDQPHGQWSAYSHYRGDAAGQTGSYPPYGQAGSGQQGYGQPGHGGYVQSGYPYAQHYSQGYGYGTPGQYGTPYPPAKAKPSLARRAMLSVGAAALAVGLVLSGVAIADTQSTGSSTAQGSTGSTGGSLGGSSGSSTGGSGSTGAFPGGSTGGSSSGGTGGSGTSGSGTSTSSQTASSTQQKGIVTVVSVLGYQNAESAGTGMILTSDGEILTNNHVIDGATSITVTVESTGKSYKAEVVGTAPTKDVAVLQLENASGLTTAKTGDSSDVNDLKVGDSVVGVGNAGGTGTLRAASGKVTALNQSITASDETGSSSEKLSGLIQVNAGIISGDSGGPLYDSDGDIVGMDTAASANSAQSTAYAIPIDSALELADEIESGVETTTVHIGLPAFIGVSVSSQSTSGSGAAIESVLSGGPAEKAGMTDGSTITKVGGTTVTGADSLKSALSKYRPGDKVTLTWTDASGQSHTATVTTVDGPAD